MTLRTLDEVREANVNMSHTVLVVEDEPNIVLSLQFILRQAGFTVRVARDGDQALRAIDDYVPNLVILDIMLPKQDGFAVCEAIRANAACRNVKIIMLSAKSREADKERALALGADEFVTKPFSTRALGKMVKDIVTLKKPAHQAK
ncbi:response regulator [uncultured Sneathiella sp.]|uniref:response regulator transcription factor n=1 Tax=uncultured Sneathiella sp. TaxID=879315 RepID=UPI0030EC9FA4